MIFLPMETKDKVKFALAEQKNIINFNTFLDMFDKMKLSSICLFFVVFVLGNCDPKVGEIDEQDKWPVGQNVYVAGIENVQNNSIARLWKNGEVQNLAGSSSNSLRSTGIMSSVARSVFVAGNDAYVAGYDVIEDGDNWTMTEAGIVTNGDEVTGRARLWKNGELQNLTNGTFFRYSCCCFCVG
jgi:hypothetical protein